MKNILFILILVVVTSFNSVENILPNGNYRVTFDKEEQGEPFECTIQNDKFYLIRKDRTESCDVIWITENKFRVVGYLEPKNPADNPAGTNEHDYGYYEVAKIDENTYSYRVKLVSDDYVLFSGKFIKKQ
ncbi:hypothetical protein [Flavobacterium sp. XGLA_31]|uniref:hypothetical protein n=1 Tax=Flavobacterium sp. XGLA_31 TaxID=3447666 RepID=UPI003F319B48